MDRDADISRSLDTMADEMTPNAADNMELPFEIKFNIPESQEADESMVVTLRHQLQRFGAPRDLAEFSVTVSGVRKVLIRALAVVRKH